jgi:hypothetical protein
MEKAGATRIVNYMTRVVAPPSCSEQSSDLTISSIIICQ